MPQLQQTGGYRVHIPYTIMEHLEPSTTFEHNHAYPLCLTQNPANHHNIIIIWRFKKVIRHACILLTHKFKLVMTNLTITKQVKLKTYGKHISSNRTEELTISWSFYQSPSCHKPQSLLAYLQKMGQFSGAQNPQNHLVPLPIVFYNVPSICSRIKALWALHHRLPPGCKFPLEIRIWWPTDPHIYFPKTCPFSKHPQCWSQTIDFSPTPTTSTPKK